MVQWVESTSSRAFKQTVSFLEIDNEYSDDKVFRFTFRHNGRPYE